MISVAVPGLSSLQGAHNLSQSASDLAATLEMARSRAMARNTYVFVGVSETGNQLTVALVESKDGSNNYDASGNWRGEQNLSATAKLKIFKEVHMADFSNLTAGAGNMALRRSIEPASSLGSSSVGAQPTPVFSWPLGAAVKTADFSKVIQFDPRGIAKLQDGSNNTEFMQRMEIGLQRAHGKEQPVVVTDISVGMVAAVQLDGMTGITRIYQP